MELFRQLKLRQKELSKEIVALEKFLKNVPEGKLVSHKKDNSFYYTKKVYLNDNLNNSNSRKKTYKEIYLPKNNKEVGILAKSEYAIRCLKDTKSELYALNKLLHLLEKGSSAQQFLDSHPGISELVAPTLKNKNKELEEWRTSDFYSNPYKPEAINVPTVIPGFKVRSKSEADILARLVHFEIPFHYEEGIQTSSGWKFPDFSVRAIVPPYKIYYWEHLGLMDSIKYFSDNLNKLNDLFLCGIVPWKNLIITTETASEPLDINWVDEIINYYLL